MGFDKKMEAHCVNTRTKLRKQQLKREQEDTMELLRRIQSGSKKHKKRRARAHTSSEEEDNDTDSDKEMVHSKSFENGAQISLVDGQGIAFAHGVIVDDEPSTDELTRLHGTEEIQFVVGHWKEVSIRSLVHGWNAHRLESDMVYTNEGENIGSKHRKVGELKHLTSFIIWHEYVKPRVRAIKQSRASKASRRKKGKQDKDDESDSE